MLKLLSVPTLALRVPNLLLFSVTTAGAVGVYSGTAGGAGGFNGSTTGAGGGCGGSSANGDDHRTLLDLLEEADGLLVGHALDRNAVDREDLVSCKIGKRLMLRKRSYLDD